MHGDARCGVCVSACRGVPGKRYAVWPRSGSQARHESCILPSADKLWPSARGETRAASSAARAPPHCDRAPHGYDA